MLLTMLTQTINTIISDIESTDIKITTGCLLYSYLNSQEDTIDLRKKALSFKDYYYSQCIDRKITNRTIGFINIERIINNKKLTDMSSLSSADYEEILKWYETQDLEVKFNPKDINPRTYGKISFSGNYEKSRFTNLHNEFLKPISIYYNSKYGIPYGNLRIVNIGDTVIPAKEITFFITDYPSSRVAQDISKGLILFNKSPNVVKLTTDGYVYIII